MPKNKLQSIIFTILMAFVMVYGMICYNISLDMGGMKNEIFLLAFHEIIIMLPVAFILEFFVVEKLSTAMAFRIVTPNDRPFVITLAISCMIVLCMCPTMSLVATVLFKQPGKDHCFKLPNGTFMAALLRRPCRKIHLREIIPGKRASRRSRLDYKTLT